LELRRTFAASRASIIICTKREWRSDYLALIDASGGGPYVESPVRPAPMVIVMTYAALGQ